jgi:DNA-directed RNA polymerase subunit F
MKKTKSTGNILFTKAHIVTSPEKERHISDYIKPSPEKEKHFSSHSKPGPEKERHISDYIKPSPEKEKHFSSHSKPGPEKEKHFSSHSKYTAEKDRHSSDYSKYMSKKKSDQKTDTFIEKKNTISYLDVFKQYTYEDIEKLLSEKSYINKKFIDEVSKGNVRAVPNILKSGADINAKLTKDGSTALHIASRQGHLDMVEMLIVFGADMGIKNIANKTPYDVISNAHLTLLFIVNGYIPSHDTSNDQSIIGDIPEDDGY